MTVRPTTRKQGETEMTATTDMPVGTGKAIRMSPPMIELLTDIATKPQMYITQWSRWDRTAHALISRGLAAIPRGNHGGQYELRITDKGRAEAIRRGIGSPTKAGEQCPDGPSRD